MEHAVSDDREADGSTDETVTDADSAGDTRSRTAVVTRPLRPTGKRSRRGAVSDAEDSDEIETDAAPTRTDKNGSGKAKVKKATKDGPSGNPIMFVVNYLKQVVAELRKVIWPNRKQMVTYTSVVLAFLVFMVALIAGADYGLARLVSLVFGT